MSCGARVRRMEWSALLMTAMDRVYGVCAGRGIELRFSWLDIEYIESNIVWLILMLWIASRMLRVDMCQMGVCSPSSRDEYFDGENRCLLEAVLVMVTTIARE